jgi:hypothetical protein
MQSSSRRCIAEVGGDPDMTEIRSVKQLAAGYPDAPSSEGKDTDG